jgi:hypothetical protein
VVAVALSRFHARRIANDWGQPYSHLRLSLDFTEVRIRRQDGVLDSIFGVRCNAKVAYRKSVKIAQVESSNISQLLNVVLMAIALPVFARYRSRISSLP